jgi:hypothetical protein
MSRYNGEANTKRTAASGSMKRERRSQVERKQQKPSQVQQNPWQLVVGSGGADLELGAAICTAEGQSETDLM